MVGGGTWLFTEAKSQSDLTRKRSEAVHRLDSEISYRLAGFRNLHQKVGVGYALDLLERPNDVKHPQFLFIENEKRPLTSLLWELRELVPEEVKSHLTQAYQTAFKFGAVRAEANGADKEGFIMKRIVEVGLSLQFKRDFNLDRWGRQFDSGANPDTIIGGLISKEVLEQKIGNPPETSSNK